MNKFLRVLNVEDSERDSVLLTRYLKAVGYELEILRVDTGLGMVDALDKYEWDVIICDYSLPTFDALGALAVLKESGLDIPLIIVSGTVGEELAVQAMRAGALDYLMKDNLSKLAPIIERELNEAENRRAQRQAARERRIIFEIIQGVIIAPSLDQFLKLVHRSISQLVYAKNCFVVLRDNEIDQYEFWVDKYDPIPDPRPAYNGFASYVIRNGTPLLLDAEKKRELISSGEAEIVGSASASWLGVPLRTPKRVIGALVLQHYEDEHAYSEADLEFLSSVGDQIALAIERKRAIAALTESEERYRSVVETASDAIITIDEKSNILFVNSAAERIFGYTVDEMKGSSLTMLMPDRFQKKHKHSIERYSETGERRLPWDYVELLGLHKDGREIPLSLSFAEFSQDGRRSFTGIISDISERKSAAESLRQSEERYRDLVENALDIIYTHDLDGNYTSVNRAAEMITGYSRDEVSKLNLRQTIAPEFLEKARRMMAAKLAGEEVTAYELEIISKNGHRIPVEVNTRIFSENGVPVGVQGIARDITDRKELEDQLRQSHKMEAIGLLAGGIAHDFNNLLTAISGYSDLTLRKMREDDPLRENIKEIKDAGERAAALTSQLLAFSRKQVLNPRVHNLNAVITEIERMLRRIIRESIEFCTWLDPELGNIKADPGQIEQVIINLAVNARDAMPNGGKLTIRTRNVYIAHEDAARLTLAPGPYVRMTVTDTGEGMDEETQRRVFEPFFTTKELGKGTGLGLSTAHGIVKQSSGDIEVNSELGRGTTFDIYLPCVDEHVQALKWVEESDEDHTGAETILLVEDEEVVRKLVSEILTNNGYTVLEAASGKAAMEICRTYAQPLELLLTDMIMPSMSGLELKDQVREMRPGTKVLFMSGYSDESSAHMSIVDADVFLIEKPFTPDRLARKVRDVLGASVGGIMFAGRDSIARPAKRMGTIGRPAAALTGDAGGNSADHPERPCSPMSEAF